MSICIQRGNKAVLGQDAHHANRGWSRSAKFFFTIVFTLYLASVETVSAQSQIYDLNDQNSAIFRGIIGDLNTFTFSLSESESMLIEVKRINLDFRLQVSDTEDGVIYAVSFPMPDWPVERILVAPSDCNACKLQILPKEKVDQSGRYELTATKLYKERHAEQISFESMMTMASIGWFKAGHDAAKLDRVYETYRAANRLANTAGEQQRSLYLAAQAAHWGHKIQTAKELALKVINSNQDATSRYRLRAMSLLANFAFEEGQFDAAIPYLKSALELSLTQGDKLMHARISNRLGLIAGGQGSAQAAYRYFKESSRAYALLGDWRKAVEEIINKGWANHRQGNLEHALNYFQQALSLAQATSLDQHEVDASFRIGQVYMRWGDFAQANRYIDAAIAKMGAFVNTELVGRVLQAKGRVLFESGMFELAKVVFEDSLLAYRGINSKRDEINVLSLLGRIYSSLGEFEKAEEYTGQVLEYDRQTGNEFLLGQSYFRLAEIALMQGKYKRALHYQEEAIQALINSDDEHLRGRLYSQAGIIYFYNDQLEASAIYFDRATKIQSDINDYNGQIETDYRKARMQAVLGNSEQALATLDAAVKKIQSGRKKIARADLKRGYLALQQKIAALKIKLTYEHLGDVRKMLQISEMFREQTLKERLEQFELDRKIPEALILKRSRLQRQLQSKAIAYHRLSDLKQRKALLRNTRKLAAQLQRLEASIRQSLESRPAGKSQAPVIYIEKIQQRLKSNSLILYFDTNLEQSYLWAISQENINVYPLPKAELIADQVTQALALSKRAPDAGQQNRRYSQKEAYKVLSSLLFFDSQINWDQYQNLIVVADGPLNFIPFSLITLPDQQQPFLANMQVSYIPSLNVLSQLVSAKPLGDTDRRRNHQDILLLANPSFLDKQKSIPEFAIVKQEFESRELIYSKKEAESILRVAGKRVVLLSRENATKATLYSQPLKDFRILHFATHGLASSELASVNGLVLSNAGLDNNLLLASEIANLQLKADLVVLSGCETGIGRLIDGEGLQGLSRAFFEAGARRVIASLWKVQDDATAELMRSFYRFLLHDLKSPAEALRLAKLHVKNYQRKNKQKPWQDPYYWAGFVLQGTGESWIE